MGTNNEASYISYGVIPVLQNTDGSKEYLLLQSNGGFWGFPKGTPENGESPQTVAIREALEEAGLRVNPEDLSFSVSYSYQLSINGSLQTKRVVLFPVQVRQKNVTLQTSEVQSHRWASYNEAVTLIDLPSIARLLEQVELHIFVETSAGS